MAYAGGSCSTAVANPERDGDRDNECVWPCDVMGPCCIFAAACISGSCTCISDAQTTRVVCKWRTMNAACLGHRLGWTVQTTDMGCVALTINLPLE